MAVRTLGKQGSSSKKLEPKRELTKNDRCDAACPAQALVAVYGVSGTLMFCNHHFNKIMSDPVAKAKLDSFAFDIYRPEEQP